MRISEIEKKEKQVIAWLEERTELLQMKRNRDVVDLPKPLTKGYTLSFELNSKGKERLNERVKELFHFESPLFFIKDKTQAKKAQPNTEKRHFGDYHVDPDSPDFEIGYFWPLVISTRNGKIPEKLIKEITRWDQIYHFRQIHQIELYGGETVEKMALRISPDLFEVKRKKYKQKRIWVEEAYIDSRLDYLYKKLFDEKNWYKYGPEHTSYQRDPGKQPKGLYHQKVVGMSPSYPYKRTAQKEQTQTLIQKAKEKL